MQLPDADLYGECRAEPAKKGHDMEVHCNPGTIKIMEGQWFDQHEDDWCGEHPDFPAYIASSKEPSPKTSGLSQADQLAISLKKLSPEDLEKTLKFLRYSRDSEIIKLYFGITPEGDSYEIIHLSRIFKLTRERTRQIIDRSIKTLEAVLT